MNSLKKGEGVPLLNFEGGPGILLLIFEGGPGAPLLNFKGVPGPLLNFEGDPGSRVPGSQCPGLTFTPCHDGEQLLLKVAYHIIFMINELHMLRFLGC